MTGKGVSLRRDWHCPHCGVSVITFVTLSATPTHRCKKKLKRTIALQEKETTNP